jgi:hypothetical protein
MRTIKLSERILVGPELNPRIKRGEQPMPKRKSMTDSLTCGETILQKTLEGRISADETLISLGGFRPSRPG